MPGPSQDNVRIMAQVQNEVRQIHDAQRATVDALDEMASAVAGLFHNLFSGLVERELLDPDDPAMVNGRKLIDSLHKVKERIGKYQDMFERTEHRVTCPNCQAALKTLPGEKVSRCQWCGTEF
ncbi:MAG TPA: hypothetical protein VM425_15480 [Myxococcota bacterium]|nr:hypothetical protein [Myxococcota bacterium]